MMSTKLHSLVAGVLQSMTQAELSEAPLRIAGLVLPTGEGFGLERKSENPSVDLLDRASDDPWRAAFRVLQGAA